MVSSSRSTIFRVTGLPCDKAARYVESAPKDTIRDLSTEDEQQQLHVSVACIRPCDGNQTSSALVEFKGGNPGFLSSLEQNPLSEWQVEMGDVDVSFDRHFFGFTQLYSIAAGQPVTAE
jgi:hypothetical protein